MLWILIGAYLTYEEFYHLVLTCTFFSRLKYQWHIYDVLVMSDYYNLDHKKFIFLFQEQFTSQDLMKRFFVDKLAFHFYTSTVGLDSIILQLQPRTLILDYTITEPKCFASTDYFPLRWMHSGYRSGRITNYFHGRFMCAEIDFLDCLVKLKKVTVSGHSNYGTGHILIKLPQSITHLTIDLKLGEKRYPCPFCSIGALRNFKALVELTLFTHPFGLGS